MTHIYRRSLFALMFLTFGAQAQVSNPNNPPGYQHFKYNYTEMVETANPTRLPHRIFYQTPSRGPHAAWFDAVKQGDLARVRQMVANGQDIEAKDSASLGQTALGWAAFIGDEEMVNYLLSEGADLWATDRGDVYNALKSAVLGRNVKVVRTLYERLKNEVDINDQSLEDDGETLLMVAASNDRREIVSFLIEQGADLNLSTHTRNPALLSYDQSALTYACQRGLSAMQALLIAHGARNHRSGLASCD